MIRAIIFDCFGVLTEDAWHAFRTALPPGPKEEARYLMHRYSAGMMDKAEFINDVARVTAKSTKYVVDLLENKTAKNTPLLEYIDELRKRGLKIGLLSNIANNWIRETFLTVEEQELFDEMIFSFEVGITKPDPRIFMLACERLRVGPHEAVLVDDIESYCEAAKTEGLKAITYNKLSQMKQELEKIIK